LEQTVKRTEGRDIQNAIPIEEPVCKIGKGEGFFFAAAGIVRGEGFDVGSLIAKGSEIHGTIDQKIETVLVTIREPLTRVLEIYRRNNPLDYKSRFKTAPALQILFFGIENGSSFMAVSDWKITTPSPSGSIQVEILYAKCPGDLCPSGEQFVMAGEKDAISNFLKKNPGYWKVNPVEAVRELIEFQITDVPALVGPPIDILYVDKNGARWIQKKEQCPDI